MGMLDTLLEQIPTWSTSRLVNKYRSLIGDAYRSPPSSGATIVQGALIEAVVQELSRRGFGEGNLEAIRARAIRKLEKDLDRIPRDPERFDPWRLWQAWSSPGWSAEIARRIESVAPRRWGAIHRGFVDVDHTHWLIDRSVAPNAVMTFHPVGQGLFASGHLFQGARAPAFTWTFDCGTSSSQSLVDEAIKTLAAQARGRDVIDLVVFSHFDHDHISGLVRLLSRFRVKTLLIPLVPLWQRLLVLFSNTAHLSNAERDVLLDPVPAIRAVAGERVESIVLVPPSNGDGAPPPGESGGGPADPSDDGPSENRARRAPDRRPVDVELEHDARTIREESGAVSGGARLSELPVGGVLRIPGQWEFVPYNDARRARGVDQSFVDAAESLRTRLLLGAADVLRRDALKALKRHYETTFKTATARNAISLFVYAGGVDPMHGGIWVRTLPPAHPGWGVVLSRRASQSGADHSSVLYTGDGYLERPDAWQRLASYLGPVRANSVMALQVMHHGARKNWHKGLAQQMAPTMAVFSANPANKKLGHPHDEVVDDFTRHSLPCLVNRVGLQLIVGL